MGVFFPMVFPSPANKRLPSDGGEQRSSKLFHLEAVLEEGGDDPAYIVHALGVIARAKNMSQLAREAGLSREGGCTRLFLKKATPPSLLWQKLQKRWGCKSNLKQLRSNAH